MSSTTLQTLPTEVVSHIYSKMPRPVDYNRLMESSSFFNAIGQNPVVKIHFYQDFFARSREQIKKVSKVNWSNSTYWGICAFFAASGVDVQYSDIRLAVQEIPTQHFCNYTYPNFEVKKAILDLFRDLAIPTTGTITLPNLTNDALAQASIEALYQETVSKTLPPRRVYYDVTLQKDTGKFPKGSHFYMWFSHTDSIFAFDDTLSLHTATLVYKDESVITDATFASLFSFESFEENNIVIDDSASKSSALANLDTDALMFSNLEDLPSPSKPKPQLLRTYNGCKLLTDVKKGGLRAGQTFAYSFVYEQENDLVCIEFCDQVGQGLNMSVEARGYLLCHEHSLDWK